MTTLSICVFFFFAFGKTERLSGALRQQLGGHMGLRSRHEGLRAPSAAAAPPRRQPPATSPTPTGNRGEVLTRRGGWGSAGNNGLQSQHISASAVGRHVLYTVLRCPPQPIPPPQRLIRCQMQPPPPSSSTNKHPHAHKPAGGPRFPAISPSRIPAGLAEIFIGAVSPDQFPGNCCVFWMTEVQ